MKKLAALCLFSLLLIPSAVPAQIFLEAVGATQGPILGDATYDGEVNSIEILSFAQSQFAIFNQQGGAGAPKRERSEVFISKAWDPASIPLLAVQGEAERLTTCIFRFYRPGGVLQNEEGGLERAAMMPKAYLTIELTDAYITSYSVSAGGIEPASESLSLNFDTIRYTYRNTIMSEEFLDNGNTPARALGLAETINPRTLQPSDSFEFVLPERGQVGIQIFDANDHWVKTLYDGDAAQSDGVLRWDTTNASGQKVAAGSYKATVQVGDAEIVRLMVVGD